MNLGEEIIMIIPRVKIAIDSVIDLTSQRAVRLKGKISFFDLGQCRNISFPPLFLQLFQFVPCSVILSYFPILPKKKF